MKTTQLRHRCSTLIAALLALAALSCADYPEGASKNRGVIVPDMSFDAAEDTVLTVAADAGVFNQIEEADPTTWTVATTGTLVTTGPSDCDDCEKGSVEMAADGGFTYTPADDFEGNDYLYISVASDTGGEGEYIILFEVAGSNDPPTANADSAATDEDAAVSISPLENDTDIDLDDTFAMVSVGDPEHGSVTADIEAGEVSYTPAANYFGEDSFTYVIADAAGVEATAIVTVTINPVNDPPTAEADAYTAGEDQALTVSATQGVLGNDSDIDNEADEISATAGTRSTTGGGSVEMAADGGFTYTPAANFSGDDSFIYEVADDEASAQGTVTVTVAAVNDDPTAGDDGYDAVEDTILRVSASTGLLSNDTDIESDSLAAIAGTVTTSNGGAVAISANGGFIYAPAADFNGSDSFVYTVLDGNGGRATGNVRLSISPVNDAPVAVDDRVRLVDKDRPIIIDALANDSDVDGDDLTISGFTNPSHGVVSLNSDNTITYTPGGDLSGTDSFRYYIRDDFEESEAIVTIEYENKAPTAETDEVELSGTNRVEWNLLGNDTDPENSPLTLSWVVNDTLTAPGATTVSVGGYLVDLTFAESGQLFLQAQSRPLFTSVRADFQYGMVDAGSPPASATGTLSITITGILSSNPVILGSQPSDSHNTDEDRPLAVNANAGLLDRAGPVWSVTPDASVVTTFGGTTVVNTNGSFSYTPPLNFSGSDSFVFIATGTGDSARGQAVIDVNSVNDAPLAQNDTYSLALGDRVTISETSGLLQNDVDIEGGDLTVTSVDTGGLIGSLDDWRSNGRFRYTAPDDAGGIGTTSFSYTVSDGSASQTAMVTLVFGANGAPLAAQDAYDTGEDVPLIRSAANGALANDSDPDDDGLLVSAASESHFGGTVDMSPDGSFTYTPPPHFTGTDSFGYRLSDGTNTVNGLIVVRVTPADDPPLAGDNFYSAGRNTPFSMDAAGGLLANDIDPDGDPLVITTTGLVDTDMGGTALINADGSFTYDPPTDFTGTDRFDYTMGDGTGRFDAATVIVTVSP